MRRPERESVIEGKRILILELNCPGRPTVQCFVDAKICGIRSNGHQISNTRAESLYIAELQCFGAWNYTGIPRLSAISGDGKCTGATGCPDHLRIHRPHRDQAISGAAVLGRQRGLMKMRWRQRLRDDSCAGERRNEESSQ